MSTRKGVSSEETQWPLSSAQQLRAEAWARWLAAAAEMVARSLRATLGVASKLIEVIRRKGRRRAATRQLLALDDAILKDIGLSRCQVWAAVEELFSSPPSEEGNFKGKSRVVVLPRSRTGTEREEHLDTVA